MVSLFSARRGSNAPSIENTEPIALALSAMLVVVRVAQAHAMARATTGVVNSAVVAAESGLPLTGVVVRVVDMNSAETVAESVTSEDGRVDFSEVPFGLYQVSVVAPEGYAGSAGPLVYLDEDNAESMVSFALEPLLAALAAQQSRGMSLLAWLLLLGGGAAAAAIIITQTGDAETG
jgi:hypothetical protein